MTEYNEVMMTEVDQAEWIVKNDPNSRFCFGVDVGGTTIKLGFFSNQGELIDKWEIPTRTMDGGKYILDDKIIFKNSLIFNVAEIFRVNINISTFQLVFII